MGLLTRDISKERKAFFSTVIVWHFDHFDSGKCANEFLMVAFLLRK